MLRCRSGGLGAGEVDVDMDVNSGRYLTRAKARRSLVGASVSLYIFGEARHGRDNTNFDHAAFWLRSPGSLQYTTERQE